MGAHGLPSEVFFVYLVMANYLVYRYSNNINGKVYIGLTKNHKKRKVYHRYLAKKGQLPFHRALRKYGEDSFEYTVLQGGLSLIVANELEIEIIKLYNATDSKYGYNVCIGGKGHIGLFGEKHPMFGVKRPDLSERNKALKGTKLSDERIKQIAISATGRIHSENTKQLMSKNKIAFYKENPVPKEIGEKISAAKKEMKLISHNAKKIICNETGIVYLSSRKAALDIVDNVDASSNIRMVANGLLKQAYGYTFNWIAE